MMAPHQIPYKLNRVNSITSVISEVVSNVSDEAHIKINFRDFKFHSAEGSIHCCHHLDDIDVLPLAEVINVILFRQTFLHRA